MYRLLSITIATIMACVVNAQEYDFEYAYGCLPEEHPEQLPRQATLVSKDYDNLPSSYSLRQYCPYAKTQGKFGTCTSWATTYAFRTIIEAVNRGWTDKDKITAEAFSPLFIYAQIKHADDLNCRRGSHISDAMKKLKTVGAVKKTTFDFMCANIIPEEVMNQAAVNKIGDFATIVAYGTFPTAEQKKRGIKKAICNNKPVVIAMRVYPSFHKAKDVWDGDQTGSAGYHAMCVVGYDDNKYGGAFLIMNSWGDRFGDQGFVWVKYDDFVRTVDQAYTGTLPLAPSPVTKKNKLGGEIDIKLSTGDSPKVSLKDKYSSTYKLDGEYISGTRYRIYLTNQEPAYVYILGLDGSCNASVVFPPADNVSPLLSYKGSQIAVPSEDWYIEIDDTTGVDQMCILYSKQAIDIDSVVKSLKTGNGTAYKRISQALGTSIVSPAELRMDSDKISFSTESEGSVVAIITEIAHV